MAAWVNREVVGAEAEALLVEIANRRPRFVFVECCSADVHEAIKADPARWQSLPFVGIQDGCGGCDYELRNCSCMSTLAKPTKVDVIPDHRSAL